MGSKYSTGLPHRVSSRPLPIVQTPPTQSQPGPESAHRLRDKELLAKGAISEVVSDPQGGFHSTLHSIIRSPYTVKSVYKESFYKE